MQICILLIENGVGFSNVMLVFRGAIIMPPVTFLFCCSRIFANFDGTSADIGPDFNSGWVIYDNQKSAEFCEVHDVPYPINESHTQKNRWRFN